MLVIGITGSPGTGKTYFSKIVQDRFRNVDLIELNDIIRKRKAFTHIDKNKVMTADIRKLNRIIKEQLKQFSEAERKTEKRKVVIYVGHIVPELNIKLDACFVMRAHLSLLAKRMAARRYSQEKIKENLISEAVDYCGTKAKNISKKIYEIETYAEKKRALRILEDLLKDKTLGNKHEAASKKVIDKMPELLKMIKNKNIYKF